MFNRPIAVALAAALVLFTGGCSKGVEYLKKADDIARPEIQAANNEAMDAAQRIICNNVFSAEQRFIKRHSLSAEDFGKFCGRNGPAQTRTQDPAVPIS